MMKDFTILPKLMSLLFLSMLINSCADTPREVSIKNIADEYYQVYQKRNDFNRFLDFYDENLVLEDIINGDKIIGKEALSEFFDWDNPNLARLDSLSLIIEEQVFEDQKVITKGYFTPFKWGEATFGAMHFTTILTFNEEAKIIKHVDWINYPSTLVDYSNRKNSNDWIDHN